MRNNKVNRYFFKSLGEIFIAILATFLVVKVGEFTLKFLREEFYSSELIYIIYSFFSRLKNSFIGYFILRFILIFTFLSFYYLITYKKNKALASIIEETEIMAKGDLDRVIKVEYGEDIKSLAENINDISKKLKERTVSEINAQKTKNDLITNVCHDLRTPLTSILGYLELIDNDKYRDEITLRHYVNIAHEKAKNLNVLINDLFELTKLRNNSINLNKMDINLVELVGQIVATFEYSFNRAEMESRLRFSEERLMVNADPEKLVRAFENLLSNAIKYGKEGHFVDIITKLEDNMAVVQVINYGEPIPSFHLPYIFDRFYRADESRNSKIGGSGLGLAITKNIIELHNGEINVFSDEERTIFEIKLLNLTRED